MKQSNSKYVKRQGGMFVTLLKILKTSVILSKMAWTILSVGWLLFLLSLVNSWQVPSSGALMICAVVLAEMLHRSRPWVGFWTSNPNKFVARNDTHFRIFDLNKIGNDEAQVPNGTPIFKALEKMDRAPLKTNRAKWLVEGKIWSLNSEAYKYDLCFNVVATITVIFGSGLWGYGHLLWSAQ